jgi:hypothetical protein
LVCQPVNAREIKDLRGKSGIAVSMDGTPSLGVLALNHAYARRIRAGSTRVLVASRVDRGDESREGRVKTAVTPFVGAKSHTRQHGTNVAGNDNRGRQC